MIDRYQTGKAIKQDRISRSHEARDLKMDRDVVVQRILPELPEEDLARWRDSFTQITGQLSALKSLGIRHVIDGGVDSESAYLIVETLDGPRLSDRLKDGPLSLEEFEQFSGDLLSTLAELHAHRMYHSGLTPESIHLTQRTLGGMLYKLTDLGFSSMVRSATGQNPEEFGLIAPHLMPPEYFSSPIASQESEQYNTGSLYYLALAGEHPLEGLEREELIRRANLGDYPTLHELRPEIPKPLSDWIGKMTAPDPDDRFASLEHALKARPNIPRLRIKLVKTEKNKPPGLYAPNDELKEDCQGRCPVPTLPELRQPISGFAWLTIALLFGALGYYCYLHFL